MTLYDPRFNMKTMILELGTLIRNSDDECKYREHWTTEAHEGNYMKHHPLDTMNEQALAMLHHQMLGTLELILEERG